MNGNGHGFQRPRDTHKPAHSHPAKPWLPIHNTEKRLPIIEINPMPQSSSIHCHQRNMFCFFGIPSVQGTAFYDGHAIQFFDPENSEEEDRFLLLGSSFKLKTLVVCHCFREEETVIRIISARKADKNEEQFYGVKENEVGIIRKPDKKERLTMRFDAEKWWHGLKSKGEIIKPE